MKVPGVTEIVGLLSPVDSNAPLIQQASRRGTAVHEYCEMIDYGAPPDLVEAELYGYVTAYLAFLRDYRPEWLYIETPLHSEEHGYAGRVDRIGYIDKAVTVVDIKTTASMDRAAKIKLACQLAGYTDAFEERYGIKVSGGLGVQLKKDGKYTVHEQRKIESKYGFMSRPMFYDLLTITNIIGGYTWQKN